MEMELKKEWSEKDLRIVEEVAAKWLKSRFFETAHSNGGTPFVGCKTWAQFDKILGTAYTSTGMFACYGICNTSLYLDAEGKYKVEFFALSKTGAFVFAVCWDEDENEILVPIN
jgi:hypothetical protein